MTATLASSNAFSDWQPEYAAHGIATFPVEVNPDRKKPMVSNYGRFGLPASAGIAKKYPDATAIGFMVGRRTGLSIVDVDTPDERVLVEALDRHGPTPIIVRSGSGHHQAWYRHNGEKRLIRPESDKPIDILGSGFVVAPPSRGIRGDYRFVQGGLDDIGSLPVMRNVAIPQDVKPGFTPAQPEVVVEGNRDNQLWRHCMRQAHCCDDFEALLNVARTANEGYLPPMPDADVVKTAKSAWGYTERGENRVGQTGAWFQKPQAQSLARDPYLFALIAWLKAENGPASEFWITNGFAACHLGWPLDKLQKARNRAIKDGWIVMIHAASQNRNAVYGWGPAAKSQSPPLPPRKPGLAEFLKQSWSCRRERS